IVIPPAIFFYYSTLFDSRFKTLQQNLFSSIPEKNDQASMLKKYGERQYFYRYYFSENTKLKILFIYSLFKKNILLEFEADYFFKLFYKSSHQLNN
ncbi:hypothetical protein P7H29_12875, partial [Enterococcus pseudoavium]|uniref:hypothetical protein n=1 Tax=Enterococcus pseudoavium TaxID=44007 RepID=UPI00288D2AB9